MPRRSAGAGELNCPTLIGAHHLPPHDTAKETTDISYNIQLNPSHSEYHYQYPLTVTNSMTSEKVQVLICGGGSAGLTAAIWLARFGIDFKILERRPGPLEIGQADGVQCRTVEIFESLGISEKLLEEAYHVMEVAFWSPGDDGQLQRKDLAYDTEKGLSHLPHVILNQARINDMMLQEVIRLRGNGTSGVMYNSQVESVRVLDDAGDYAVEAVVSQNGETHRYRAQYAIVSDLSSLARFHLLKCVQ